MIKKVEKAINQISKEFKENRAFYLTESDMKCRLFKLIDNNEIYISGGIKTFLVHTEINLRESGEKNRIDIYISKPLGFKLNERNWKWDDSEEEIGIELKFNYGTHSQESLLAELNKDKKRLLDYEITHKYIVCFDHNGKFTEEILENFKDVNFIYVDGKNKKIYQNFGK